MNEETFLLTLHAEPNDELTWLALADWLEENGQTDRAELVRIVRQLRPLPFMRRGRVRQKLEKRLAELLLAGTRPVVPELTNSIGMRFVLIPAGTFRMGSPASEKGRGSSEPAHQVTITKPFYFGRYVVTQQQYVAVIGENPSLFCRGEPRVENVSDEVLANFPVEQITYHQAQEFLARLAKLPAETEAKRVYRLPTEAEWEYACRAGWCVTTAYITGTTLTPKQACYGQSTGQPVAVGTYTPNAFGLYEMHGNVWEWCSDWHGEYESGPLTDPKGPDDGSGKVNRGGCWHNPVAYCRAADRNRSDVDNVSSGLGMRVVLEVK